MFYTPSENVVFVARRGVFRKRELICKEDSGITIDLANIQESNNEGTFEYARIQPEEKISVDNSLSLRRSGRVSIPLEFYGFHITIDGNTFISDRHW